MNDDSNHVGCPRCGDDSDACLCFVVLTWEGSHLADWRGDLEHSSLDRILHWGHGGALMGAPPSRDCPVLSGLPGRLAAAIETYWLEASVAIDIEDITRVRSDFIAMSRASPSDLELDPEDPRHPRHDRYQTVLLEHFRDDLQCHDTLPEARIAAHVVWAKLGAAESATITARSDGMGIGGIWQSVTSPDPLDTWRRMEAMLESSLAVIEPNQPPRQH